MGLDLPRDYDWLGFRSCQIGSPNFDYSLGLSSVFLPPIQQHFDFRCVTDDFDVMWVVFLMR